MAREVICRYKYCDNLGVAVNPIKFNGKYYCETCLTKYQHESELRKQIMNLTLEILPKEIPSLINKVITQWMELDYSLEYMIYTLNYIKRNKSVLNHVHGVRYYMSKDEIKNGYDKLLLQQKYKEQKDKEFEISNEQIEFKPIQNINRWSDLI